MIGASDTGYTGATTSRFGWDVERFTQTFTLAEERVLDSIYIAYNAFENGDTLTMTLEVNGTNYTGAGITLDGNNFSGVGSDGNGSPVYWMQFDLSGENITLNAGSNNFAMDGISNTGNSWALAPMYGLNNNPYAGGSLTGTGISGGNDDLAFAVTTTAVPEPSSAALIGLGSFTLLLRRRQ